MKLFVLKPRSIPIQSKKQCYKYRDYNSNFVLKTSLIKSNWNIPTPLKQAIFLEASHKRSECDMIRELNISHSTVNRVIRAPYEEQPLDYHYLPEVLCFDEFKSIKYAEVPIIYAVNVSSSDRECKTRILIIHK